MQERFHEERAMPGETQAAVMAHLKKGDASAENVAAAVSLTKKYAVKTLNKLERMGVVAKYEEHTEPTRKWERSFVVMYRWLQELPPKNKTSEHRRAWFREYRRKQREGEQIERRDVPDLTDQQMAFHEATQSDGFSLEAAAKMYRD